MAAAASVQCHSKAYCPGAEQSLRLRFLPTASSSLSRLPLCLRFQEPARGKGGPPGMFAGAAGLLQLRLLEVYLALPAPSAYILEHEALTKLSMRAVRGVAVAGALTIAESALRPWLDRCAAPMVVHSEPQCKAYG